MQLKTILLTILLALGACASLRGTTTQLEGLPLPPASQLVCCWQAEEKVEILATDREFSLTAAVAVKDGTLTVVVFDTLGRRVATLMHTAGEPHVVAPKGWPPALSRQLLIGLYLHHLAPEQWSFPHEDWTIAHKPSQKTLSYRQHQLVKLTYPADDRAERHLAFAGQNLSVRVTTLSKVKL